MTSPASNTLSKEIPPAPVADTPLTLGTLKRVQSTLTHGVAILVEGPQGELLIPIDARSQQELQVALTKAREVDDTAMDLLSSLSLH